MQRGEFKPEMFPRASRGIKVYFGLDNGWNGDGRDGLRNAALDIRKAFAAAVKATTDLVAIAIWMLKFDRKVS